MIEQFKARHIAEVTSWYKLHSEQPMVTDVIPPMGFIEPGVAAGFIIQTDSGLGIIEGYVSNPEASSEQRHEAFLAITDRLLAYAKEQQFRMVIAITRDPSIISRATTLHDFQDLGLYCLLNKEV